MGGAATVGLIVVALLWPTGAHDLLLGYLAHGLVWGVAAMLPLPPGDDLSLAMLIIVLIGVSASTFTMTAFDVVAAVSFGTPALGLLIGQLPGAVALPDQTAGFRPAARLHHSHSAG